MKEKHLLPSEKNVNAKDISLFVSGELNGKSSLLIPEKADNIFDFSLKFDQERNSSSKFCMYGLVESKWCDCDNIKIDFRIGDTSTNVNFTNNNYYFWFYDKENQVSAYTWSIISKNLAGNLSKNIYGKEKGQYFFPFELDIDKITNTNKSIYVRIKDLIKNSFLYQEFPFLYFDEDGLLLEYGNETAQFLDDSNIIEIDNNYPFFYDRHWLRRELEPSGPPFIYFTESTITIKEGENDPRVSTDKTFEVEISLSKEARGGEIFKVEVVYGLDKNNNEYTTVTRPQDLAINLGVFEFETPDTGFDARLGDQKKYVKIKINDDFFVEPTERLTLKLTPILGVLPDPERSQVCSIYFIDNDVPSKISFGGQSFQFTEPRSDVNPFEIPITLRLNQNVLVPEQHVTVCVDYSLSDCRGSYGFSDAGYSGPLQFSPYKKINITQNSTEFTETLFYLPSKEDDIQRKIVLKLSAVTDNLVIETFGSGQNLEYTIYVDKNLDYNFVEINIMHDKLNGLAISRSAYNNQTKTTTQLKTFPRNQQIPIPISASTYPEANTLITGYTANDIQLNSLVFEDNFQIEFKNLGGRIVFDNNVYDNDQTIVVNTYSGFNTSVTSGEFFYDGQKYVLRIPANSDFQGGSIIPNSPTNELVKWGFQKLSYELSIKNNTYNYISQNEFNQSEFLERNILKKPIKIGSIDNVTSDLNLVNFENITAGNLNNKITYDLCTEIQNCFSQIKFASVIATLEETQSYGNISVNTNTTTSIEYLANIIFDSGDTISYSDNKQYYSSAIIIPDPISNAQINQTKTQIFLTQDKILYENDFITDSTGLSNIYPISTSLLKTPFYPYQKLMSLYLGKILVQAGDLNVTNSQNTFPNQRTFVLSTINFYNNNFRFPSYGGFGLGSANLKKGFLFEWGQANINTRSQAVIEIVNTGVVPSLVLGRMLNPNERLWISELPIQMLDGNGNSIYPGTFNITYPFQYFFNTPIEFFTNDDFVSDRETYTIGTVTTENPDYNFITQTNEQIIVRSKNVRAFVKANYKISFLNFLLYDDLGAPVGITFNASVQLNHKINIKYNSSPNAIFEQTNKYLVTTFNTGTIGNQSYPTGQLPYPVCSPTLNKAAFRSKHEISLFGIAAIANKAKIKSITIENEPVLDRNIDSSYSCSQNGAIFIAYEI